MSTTEISIKSKPAHCEMHGAFSSRMIFGRLWSSCPICEEERRARDEAEREERERLERLAHWLRRIEYAGIPERFRNRSLQNFTAETEAQAKALAFASGYAERFDEVLETGRSALFIGKPGTGKTHLAVGIGMSAMRDNRSVLFTTVIRALRRVKDTWNRDSQESESEAVAALTYPDLLILDEVGVQFGSEAEKLILFDVLNERYERRRPTLLLSNLGLNEVRAYLGERIFDRLREDGGEVVVFDWASWRGRPEVSKAT